MMRLQGPRPGLGVSHRGRMLCVSCDRSCRAAADVAEDVQDLFFLGGAQPVLVRFHIQIGGRPLTPAWRDAVANLHEYLDFNGKGTVARDEALADLVPMLRGPLGVRTQPASPSESGLDTTFARLDANGDGKLDPGERERGCKVASQVRPERRRGHQQCRAFGFPRPEFRRTAQEARTAIPMPLPLYCCSIEAAHESGRSSRS